MPYSEADTRAKQFLQFILKRYEKDGFTELSRDKLSQLIQLNQLGTPKEAANFLEKLND